MGMNQGSFFLMLILANLSSCSGIFEGKWGNYPVYWRWIIGGDFGAYKVLGLFNIQSKEVNFFGKSMYLNIADGIILAEALRYAVKRVNSRKLLRGGMSFQITDCREARVPFSTYQDVLVINGMTSYQTTSYFMSNYMAKAPMVNVLSSSSLFDHVNLSSSDSTRKMGAAQHNLFRVITSDELEARALVDILKHLNFTFVSVVSSNDIRTQETVERFNSLAIKKGVCIGLSIWISINPDSKEYANLVTKLTRANAPRAVVLLTTTNEALGLINATTDGHGLTFLSGTGLRASITEAKFNATAARGLILLQNPDTFDEGFRRYFMNLKLSTNKYSWFAEYWSILFNCSISYKYRILNRESNERRPRCSGWEKLTDDKVDLRYVNVKPLLIAMETIACAVKYSENNFNCSPSNSHCSGQIMRGAVKYLGRKPCFLKDSVLLNDRGFYGNRFKILNFNGSLYSEVGLWSSSGDNSSNKQTLSLPSGRITWRREEPPLSKCYEVCGKGEIEDRGEDGTVCCYKCKKCGINQITVNNTCKDCPRYEVPNDMQSGCVKLPVINIRSQLVNAIMLKAVASIGLVLNTLVIILFIRYRDYKVVKATGRELSLFIISSLYLSFGLPFLFLAKSSLTVCGIQRFALSLSMNACYIPLMLKTSRIYRIFQASKVLVRSPKLVSTKSQFLISAALITGQVLLDIVWVTSDPPAVLLQTVNGNREVAMTCKTNPINALLNLLPCFLLMSACTFFGYKTRNFPSNFNEAFSISITMYISCFLWAIFVPLLFLFDYKRDNVYLSAFLTAYFMVALGLITLCGIFGPTVYKVFTAVDTAMRTSQFFHSANTPSSASTVYTNKLAFGSFLTDRSRTSSCSNLSHKDTRADSVALSSCAHLKGQSPSVCRRDVGTDPIILDDIFVTQKLNEHLDTQVRRRRFSSF